MRACALLVLVGVLSSSGPPGEAAEGSPAGLYASALARERGLREPGVSPALKDLRRGIDAYESIVHRYPATVYADHALWQAAGLALEAYHRYRERADYETALRVLYQLEVFHPDSPFAARAAERKTQLRSLSELALLRSIDRDIRDNVERLTILLDREVPFSFERLTAPERVFFDFPKTEATPELRNATLVFTETAAVQSIRLGRHPGHTTRVVLDAPDAASCRVFSLYDPYRVVVDCPAHLPPLPEEPRTAAAAPGLLPEPGAATDRSGLLPTTPSAHVVGRFATLAPSPLAPVVTSLRRHAVASPPPRPASPRIRSAASRGSAPRRLHRSDPPSLARQLGLRVSRVVIDPGHGGHDPGARAGGLREADLVLDIARRLERHLEHQGFEVVLTRRDDHYLPLEARTTLANRVEADLFLSIHANASRNPAARGLETYFLNLAVDPEAAGLASRENASGARTMADLTPLLEAIANNSKLDESRAFAQRIQQSLVTRLQRVDPDLPNLGVKQAPFMVLIGAHMPSVLTEVSFVSNEDDAQLLADETYREEVARALFEGILRYQRSLAPALRVAQQN